MVASIYINLFLSQSQIFAKLLLKQDELTSHVVKIIMTWQVGLSSTLYKKTNSSFKLHITELNRSGCHVGWLMSFLFHVGVHGPTYWSFKVARTCGIMQWCIQWAGIEMVQIKSSIFRYISHICFYLKI